MEREYLVTKEELRMAQRYPQLLKQWQDTFVENSQLKRLLAQSNENYVAMLNINRKYVSPRSSHSQNQSDPSA